MVVAMLQIVPVSLLADRSIGYWDGSSNLINFSFAR